MAASSDEELTYTEKQRQSAWDNEVTEKLIELKRHLNAIGQYSISEPDLRFPQDPTIWVRGFSPSVQIQIKMQLTGKKVVLNFRPNCSNPHSPGMDAKNRLKTALHKTEFQPRNDGAYAPLADFKKKDGYPGGIPREDIAIIHRLLSNAIEAVCRTNRES